MRGAAAHISDFKGVTILIAALMLLHAPLTVFAASITIDSGHSPRHPGTTSCSGKPEYIFNNALSSFVYNRLKAEGVLVQLSRREDSEVSLDARAKSSGGTDVLLSIHHDSVQPQFITDRKHYKGQCSGKAAGFSIFVSSLNPQFNQSLSYARRLGHALVHKGLKPTLHHAEKITGENRKLIDSTLGIYLFDDLIVLKKSATPALLFEAAVIVNPEDESLASSDNFKVLVAESISEMLRPNP